LKPSLKPVEDRKPPVKRKRGRPPKPKSAGESIPETIIAATRYVYADTGFRDFSVELVLAEAGISRPTFYRHFKDKYDVISVVVERANRLLLDEILQRIDGSQSLRDVVDRGVEAYFDWGLNIGKLAGSIYREIHDPESPASVHRDQNMVKLTAVLQSAGEHSGLQLDSAVYEALVHTVEHVGHRAFWPTARSAKETQALKDTIYLILYRTLELN
jgi:AcrR family transcriptional regulator